VSNCPRSSTVCEITADDVGSDCDTDLPMIHRKWDRDCVEILQQEAAAMVATLHANSSITYAVITDIVQSADNINGTTVNFFHTETITLLCDADIDERFFFTTVDCALKQHTKSATKLFVYQL